MRRVDFIADAVTGSGLSTHPARDVGVVAIVWLGTAIVVAITLWFIWLLSRSRAKVRPATIAAVKRGIVCYVRLFVAAFLVSLAAQVANSFLGVVPSYQMRFFLTCGGTYPVILGFQLFGYLRTIAPR